MRVWVTALGIASPFAAGAAETMRALLAGERAQRPLSLFDPGDQRSRIACEASWLSVAEVAPRGKAERWSRSDALAVVAGAEALAQAKLPVGERLDLIVGATTGGTFESERFVASMRRDPALVRPDPCLFTRPLSSSADRMGEALRPFGRTRTLCSACSSGANAIALADAWIRAGLSERVLAGGTDGLCRLTFAGFNLLAAMDPEPCKPFDARRAGLNLGEGAAFLLIESEASARRRGARPLAELAGWAIGAEAHHITQPDDTGATPARLMRRALAQGGIAPAEVGYVNAHGTATPHNDRVEATALQAAFGEAIGDVWVSSSKGQIGHTLGAAGAIEAAITTLAIDGGVLPPTVGLHDVDPRCAALRHVIGLGQRADIDAAISSSFGFGGSDTVLALARPGRFRERAAEPARRAVITAGATIGTLGFDAAEAPARYLDAGEAPSAGAIAFDATAALDPARARRLDVSAARVITLVKSLFDEAGGLPAIGDPARVGLVGAVAFRDGGAGAFLDPILQNGWRSGRPADFPNLLLSSPAGHASVYLGIRGPSFTASDITLSGASALASAVDLIAADEADAAAVCAVGEWDLAIANASLPASVGSLAWRDPITEGAGALLVEAAATAEARGARVLAEIAWHGGGTRIEDASWPAPTDGAVTRVVLARLEGACGEAVDRSAWSASPRTGLAPRAGNHEALGLMAVAAAVGLIAGGGADEVLIVEEGDGAAEVIGWAALVLKAKRA